MFNNNLYKIVETSVYFSFAKDSNPISYLEKEFERLKNLLRLNYTDVLSNIQNLGIPNEYLEKLQFSVEDDYEYMSLRLSILDQEYTDHLILHINYGKLSCHNTSFEDIVKQVNYEFNKKYIRLKRDVLQKIIEEVMFLHYNFPINIFNIQSSVIIKENFQEREDYEYYRNSRSSFVPFRQP